MTRTTAAFLLLLLVLPSLGGCSAIGLTARSTRGEFVSDEQPHKLTPRFATRVYHAEDANAADMIFSDLDADTLRDRAAWATTSGQILHARMFIQPRAGRTPIEPTACSVTLRYIVLAGGEYGLYAGGGFLLPDGKPEGNRFSGTIYNANLRLVSATPGFGDLIGSGRMSLSFRVKRDEETTRTAARNADFLAFAALPTADHPLLVVEE
jgi:hypothetical protein